MEHSVNLRVQRWYAYIMRFDIIIEHIPGKENIIADALSRIFRDTYAEHMSRIEEVSTRPILFANPSLPPFDITDRLDVINHLLDKEGRDVRLDPVATITETETDFSKPLSEEELTGPSQSLRSWH